MNVKQWWNEREARERRVLMLGGVALLVMFYIFGIWLPPHRNVEALEQTLVQQRALLGWMQNAAAEAKALRAAGGSAPAPAAAGGQALFALADQSARQAGLGNAIQRVEPSGDNRVRVELTNAGFDAMVAWLIELRRRHGIEATLLAVRKGEASGRVDAQLVLEGSGA